ncbi:YceI family protein [Frankia sp. Cas3]|uniref:YceI family protein n=1 Tax=Frankia sp. Cas3 TaxID=3073926 RepID=UPI002AD4D458|nr:YceI family protein [Frankia sp. Cas3]
MATIEAATLRARLADGSLAGPWRLDPSRSTVELHTKSMWGLAPVKGTFRELSGEGALTATGEASGTLTVHSASIDTKNRKRDDHLRSADFFDSAAYRSAFGLTWNQMGMAAMKNTITIHAVFLRG